MMPPQKTGTTKSRGIADSKYERLHTIHLRAPGAYWMYTLCGRFRPGVHAAVSTSADWDELTRVCKVCQRAYCASRSEGSVSQ